MNAQPQTMLVYRQVDANIVSRRARDLMVANEQSPVVYLSVDGNNVTYRLKTGTVFKLTRAEARVVGPGRWHL